MDEQMDGDLDKSQGSESDLQLQLTAAKAEAAAANAEAAKYRKMKNDAVKERDELKKSKSDDGEKSYEALYKQSQEEIGRIRDSSKRQSITAAIKEGLIKQGVLADALKDAARLVDTSMVNWDDEEGVDSFSVEAAVKALRGSSKYLFEAKIPPTGDPKTPKNGSSKSESEMTRTEWDSISDPMKKAQAATKFKIID